MYILLFILIFIIAIIILGISIVGFLLRAIFGIGRRSSSSSRPNQTASRRTATGQQGYGQGTQHTTDQEEDIYSDQASGSRHKKIFTQDDGEYVDFEEIKE